MHVIPCLFRGDRLSVSQLRCVQTSSSAQKCPVLFLVLLRSPRSPHGIIAATARLSHHAIVS